MLQKAEISSIGTFENQMAVKSSSMSIEKTPINTRIVKEKLEKQEDNMSGLSHLDELEAEAIYIIREVAAECENPVMLYSIGKDSSVMLHLALKAFYPEKPPFPFLHVNTTWKFKEMIEFRDKTAKELGIEMLEYINEDGVKQGINPFDHGSAYTDIMKTQALKQALNKYGFTAAFGGGRRGNITRRMNLVDTSSMSDPKVPQLELAANIEVPVSELQRGIKASEKISDHITLIADTDYFELLCEGDTDSADLRLEKDSLVSINVESQVSSMFPLDYFSNLIKAMPSDIVVKIELDNDYPAKFNFNVAGDKGRVMYLLAPRIENE